MGTPSQTLRELVDSYTWCTVNVDAPDWYICPIFKTCLGEEESFNQICSAIPLSFAPGLLDVLQSSSPPSLDFFRSLPPPPLGEKVWAVYALLLEKAGYPAQLYIGSGTHSLSGVNIRFRDYDQGKNLPRFVQATLEQGYTISYRGLLCWAPLPSDSLIPSARVRFVAVEAVFTFIFFACFETKLDAIWAVFLPWKRETVDWLPLCSHTALMERPAGVFNMTEEQLKAYNDERKRHHKERTVANATRAIERRRANDLEGYLARNRRESQTWALRNKAKVLKTAAGVRARAIASKAHECKTCNISSQSRVALAQHLATKAHQEQLRIANGGSAKSASGDALRSRRSAAKNKADKRFYCALCDKAFGTKGHLAKHNTAKKHLEKVAAASS
jgi:hypothetical protein